MNRLRLFITSVGSAVGQNILDALETRREFVDIIGANASADSPRLFRCDRVHLVPRNDHPEHAARLLAVIRDEAPELVIPARDHDMDSLAAIVANHGELASRTLVGSHKCAEIIHDKFLSWQFAARHRLPFADTLLGGPGVDAAAIRDFAGRHGFPLIAKMRRGYGSTGVRIVLNRDHLGHAAALPAYVLQPFIGGPDDMRGRLFDCDAGLPLFHAPPDSGQYSCQCIIGPSGGLSDIFCAQHVMIMGRCEEMWRADDPALQATGRNFATAMAREGWRGSFNLQCRRSATGEFIGVEMSGRMTGGTSGRLLLGFDEIGEIARLWAGLTSLPCLTAAVKPAGRVIKTLTDGFLPDAQVEKLRACGIWTGAPRP